MNRRRNPVCLILITGLILCWIRPSSLSIAQPKVGSTAKKTTVSQPKLLSVRLAPQDMTLWGAEASQRFLVVGKYADRLERDLTTQSQFSISPGNLARIEPSGRVRALGEGEAVLKAETAGLTAQTRVYLKGAGEKRPFSFARDIGGILTKRGCNSSECHGGVKGQAGFKLSLNALYPREDYQWIVEGGNYQVLTVEPAGPKRPRIDQREPEKSLLLLKPTFAIPHGGGKRFAIDSADYQKILRWIRQGAPYGAEGKQEENSRIERLEVFPREGVLEKGGSHQLLVTAYLSNGQQEDVTEEVLYVSNNTEVVTVSPDGRVQAVAPGEAAIMVRASGQAVSTRFGVMAERLADYPKLVSHNFIDEHVFAKLRKFNIIPSELSSDAEFLRRVCLDLTGTLPPNDRAREFLASRDPQKRQKLIDTLLNTPEYLDYWTFRMADLFRASSSANGAPEHGYVYWQWIRDSVVRNKPYDQIARERIAAQGFEGASRHYLPYGEEPRPEDIMPEEVRVFMGRRLDCAQCHNHPFESWSQDQFWGMATFFGGLNRTEWTGFGATVMFDDPAGRDPDYGEDKVTKQVINPRTKKEIQPAFLDGKPLPANQSSDPRLALANWITSHPYFAETAVNRMWSYLFGRGLVDPVDDFRSTNPSTHPELLQALAQDFREQRYDLKQLLKRIVYSRTYQLSSVPNKTNQDDGINYSHMVPRLLDAEVLLDAISNLTGVPELFKDSSGGMAPPGTRAIQLKMPDLYPSRFLDMYGRPNRERVPERNMMPNLNQALHTLVGATYSDKISNQQSRLEQLLSKGASDDGIIEQLYLAAFCRFATLEEQSTLKDMIVRGSSRKAAFQDLLWALMSSREFAYNH